MNVILWFKPIGGLGHSQNAWLDYTTIFSRPLILGMPPSWGFYPTNFPCIGWHLLKRHQCPSNVLPIPIPMKRIKGKIKCVGELL
jgi:hypothetical protein